MADTHDTPGPGRLSVIRTVTDGIVVISLRGEIDHHTIGHLQRALAPEDAGADSRVVRIVLDFSGVTFMDSTGVNALISVHRALRGTPGWIRLAGPQPSVRRVIELVGLDTFIDCYPTLHGALAR
ncbi:STAS domain-containing protein [Streptomyces minutiscleroticus]|uniref:STAS domain-containing protein n=1 Tax=Streptomyces minutiscleroticus TaxID=68238 RepID=UPI003330B680